MKVMIDERSLDIDDHGVCVRFLRDAKEAMAGSYGRDESRPSARARPHTPGRDESRPYATIVRDNRTGTLERANDLFKCCYYLLCGYGAV